MQISPVYAKTIDTGADDAVHLALGQHKAHHADRQEQTHEGGDDVFVAYGRAEVVYRSLVIAFEYTERGSM